ncbi:MAG: PQQ-dependent sugar dehydrogenase [Actinomycetota bacterium]
MRSALGSATRPRRAPAAAFAALLAVAPSALAPPAVAAEPEIVAVRVVGELSQAVAFTFSPDGRVWFVEKAEGDVGVFSPATGAVETFFHVPDVAAEVEQGLVGIELDPAFPGRPFVYLYATRFIDGALRDQILRVRDAGGRGAGLRVVWDSPASAEHQHSGGRLLFGPDGSLFVAVGDARDPAAAQDVASERGKILRMTPGGAPASTNPDPGSRVYASGIRNSFGLAFDPLTGDLWETENGPECNDEVNRIEPGANYGWGPGAACADVPDPAGTNVDGEDPVPPELSFTPVIAPTGIAFCEACGLGPRSEGAMFFGDYAGGDIHRATLDDTREHVVREEVVTDGPGLVTSVEVGPDGALYFSSYLAIFRLELRGGPSPTATATPGSPSPASPSPPPPPSSPGAGGDEGSSSVALALGAAAAAAAAVAVGAILVGRRRRASRAGPTGP